MKTQVVLCLGFGLSLFLANLPMSFAQPGALPRFVEEDAGVKDPKDKAKEKEKDKIKEKDKDKKPIEKKPPEPVTTDLFTPLATSNTPSYYTPSMMGDWNTIFVRQNRAVVGITTVTTTVTTNPPGTSTTATTTTQTTQTRPLLVPLATRGAFKIAENGNPMPTDRVFGFWNYYSGMGLPQHGANAPLTTSSTVTSSQVISIPVIATVTTNTTTTTVLPGASRVALNRETFGFEKTFLDGNASIEFRAPLVQQGGGNADYGANTVGDLTIIGKYALYLDRSTGNVFSTGLAVTAPTSRAIETTEGTFRDALIQPFIGYTVNADRVYLQAFHSIVVPTDSRDVTIAFNDLAVGYWLYRGDPSRALNFIAPTAEVHVTTPLNHRGLDGPIVVPDVVSFTAGVHLGLFRNGTLSLAAGAPVTGPRPYTIETFAYFNWRY